MRDVSQYVKIHATLSMRQSLRRVTVMRIMICAQSNSFKA